MLTQEQLDEIIRANKGKHAVERMIGDAPLGQLYLLDNGWHLYVSKQDGSGKIMRSSNLRWLTVKKF